MRRALLFLGMAGVAALLLWGLRGLPRFGSYPGPYGDVLNSFAVGERKATDVVSARNGSAGSGASQSTLSENQPVDPNVTVNSGTVAAARVSLA